MRREPYKLRELLGPVVEAMGYELVGIEYVGSGKHSVLRIYIDHDNGISVDDCQQVSYQVSGVLDVEDPVPGQYMLEVSSPGLDRPLFKAEDFDRFAGQQVKVRLAVAQQGQRKFQGLLQGLQQDMVVIQVADGGEIRLPFDHIEQARLVPEI